MADLQVLGMNLKLANPLQYPLAVLISGIFLVGSARVLQLPAAISIPGAVAIATAGAAAIKGRQPNKVTLENRAVNREFQQVRQQAVVLGGKAHELSDEANQLLTTSEQLELLGVVQYACDRIQELPQRLDRLAQRLALLSLDELKQQLAQAQEKVRRRQGVAQAQWGKLASSLQRNVALTKQGEDVRQAQLASLSTLIAESDGVLQQLQNKLRNADLSSSATAGELRQLSQELRGLQENFDLLLG